MNMPQKWVALYLRWISSAPILDSGCLKEIFSATEQLSVTLQDHTITIQEAVESAEHAIIFLEQQRVDDVLLFSIGGFLKTPRT